MRAVNRAASMHVAILADGVYPWMLGGIQRHTALLSQHLAAKGARVTLMHAAPTRIDLPPLKRHRFHRENLGV